MPDTFATALHGRNGLCELWRIRYAAMRFITPRSGLVFATLTSTALAKLGIEPMALSYKIGDIVRIYYWTDSEYSVCDTHSLLYHRAC